MAKKLLLIGSGAVFAVGMLIASVGMVNADQTAVPISVSAPITITTAPCPIFNHSLTVGSTGTDVTQLQTYLHWQGYLGVSATGYFGPLTQAAVAKWQVNGRIVGLGGSGSGIFGPLSRAFFARVCIPTTNGYGNSTSTAPTSTTQTSLRFTGSPATGIAPLTVQFTVTAPQGTTVGNSVNFGDGATGNLGFAPVCSSCNLLATVSHTYSAPGTYTVELINGVCECFAAGNCNCPNLQIIATTTITVTSVSTSTSTTGIQQLNSPGSVALSVGGIAEIRNASFYFTLSSMTTTSATINVTQVGCWNSFPSDPTPGIRCMIAVVPIPPQTLTVGQKYGYGNYGITLTSIASGTAMFSVQ